MQILSDIHLKPNIICTYIYSPIRKKQTNDNKIDYSKIKPLSLFE